LSFAPHNQDHLAVGRYSLALGILLATGLSTNRARATELSMDCSEASEEQTEELEARLKLLLHARAERAPARVEVRCSGEDVRVAVVGERATSVEVDTAFGLVDGVLDAVERALDRAQSFDAQAGEPPEVESSQGNHEDAVHAPGEPRDEASPSEPKDAGGVGVGVTSEYAFAPIGTLIGPRLDLAVGSGPYAASLAETLRFSSARGRGVLDFDVMAGFGFGAPFAANYDFGAHVAFGVEWFSAGIERRRLTDSTPVGQLSVRLAWPLGRFTLWAALDVRARFGTLSLGDPIDARLARVTPFLTLGGAILADPGEP